MSKSALNRPVSAGDRVVPQGFRQEFEVLEGPDRSGRYTVFSGSVRLVLKPSQFRVVMPAANRTPDEAAAARSYCPYSGTSPGPDRISVDLHGLTVAEALERLQSTLDRALLQGTREIEVVHGIGTGKVKKAVLSYLSEAEFVTHYGLSPFNPGSTIVRL